MIETEKLEELIKEWNREFLRNKVLADALHGGPPVPGGMAFRYDDRAQVFFLCMNDLRKLLESVENR